MDKETESGNLPKEIEPFLGEKPTTIIKAENRESEKSLNAGKVTFELEKDDANTNLGEGRAFKIKIWKNCTVSISKTLIPLRLALVLWFGAGRLTVSYMGVLLKERGLTPIEMSSIFSLIFISQLLGAIIAGLIADKIGNAKPVLIFYMSGTFVTMICISLAPNISDKSCPHESIILENKHFENSTILEYCNSTCYENNSGDSQNLIFTEYDDVTSNYTFLPNSPSFHKNTTLVFNTSISSVVENHPRSCAALCLSRFQSSCSITSRKISVVIYGILIVALFAFFSNSYRFFDYSSLCIVYQNKSHFGKERCFGKFGALLTTTLTAFVMNVDKSVVKKYDTVFYVSEALMLLSIFSVWRMEAVILPPGKKLTRKALNLIKNTEIIVFIGVIFVAGNAFSFNAVFNLWFLDSINAPKLVISLHPVMSSVYGIPTLLMSHWWIKQLGTNRILFLGFLAYAVNQLSFSFITNPWISLIVEITVVFHFDLFWVALVIHCRKLAPEGLKATLNAVSGYFHFGLGRSSGVAVGGLLVNHFGLRTAYRLMSALCFSTAILYLVFLNRKFLTSRSNCKYKNRSHDTEITNDIESQPIREANTSGNSSAYI